MINIQYVGNRNPEYIPLGLPMYLPAVPRIGEYIGFDLGRTVEVKRVVYYETYVSKQTSSDLPALVEFVRALDRIQKAGQPLSSVPIPDFHYPESQKLATNLVSYFEKSLIKMPEIEAIITLALGSNYK